MSRRSRKHLTVALVSGIALFSACKPEPQPEVAVDPIQNYENTPGVVDAVGFNVSIPTKDNKGFYVIHKDGNDFSTSCTAAAGEDINCFIEGEELDLFILGVTFRYNVPRDLCTYVTFEPYYYYDREVGAGPAAIEYETDTLGNIGKDTRSVGNTDGTVLNVPDGVITCTGVDNNGDGDFTDAGRDYNGDGDFDDTGTDNNNDGDFTDPAQPCVDNSVPPDGDCDDPGDTPAVAADILPDVKPDNPPDVPCEIQVDGANVSASTRVTYEEAQFKCTWDYTWEETPGPNCCTGGYSLKTGNWDGERYSYTTSPLKWGGTAANCLAGPAVDSQKEKTKAGFPRPDIWFVEDEGLNEQYEIKGPNDKGATKNNYIATYNATTFTNLATPANWPVAFHSATAVYPNAQPYYALTCYDRAKEIKSRIRLHVREWNEEKLFKNTIDKVCTIGQASCNPDSTGNETGFDNPPINDIQDWGNIGNMFPKDIL